MFGDQDGTLCDLMEGLFHIAVADGVYHPNEDLFLERVAQIFELSDQSFAALRSSRRRRQSSPSSLCHICAVSPAVPMNSAVPGPAAWLRSRLPA